MPMINARSGATPVSDSELTVINAIILDGVADEPIEGGVRIEDGRITEIGREVGPVNR
jgi:hypothetical protein